MALFNDLLIRLRRLSAVRQEVASLVAESKATAGFPGGEEGARVATVGHMDFRFPHPLTNLGGRHVLLEVGLLHRPNAVQSGRMCTMG